MGTIDNTIKAFSEVGKVTKKVVSNPDAEAALKEKLFAVTSFLGMPAHGDKSQAYSRREAPMAAPTEVSALLEENERCKNVIKDTLDAVRRVKREAERQACMNRLDDEIYKCYYRSGGIRFYGMELVEYVENILPRGGSLEEMWVSAYNSAILHMRDELAALEKKCEAIRAEAEPDPFIDNSAVLHAIGYENCSHEISYFTGGLYRKDEPATVQLYLNRLKRAVKANQEAAREADRCRASSPAEEPGLQYADLLEAMRETLNDSACAHLADPVGQTQEEYSAALQQYVSVLRERLLNRYGEGFLARERAAAREKTEKGTDTGISSSLGKE